MDTETVSGDPPGSPDQLVQLATPQETAAVNAKQEARLATLDKTMAVRSPDRLKQRCHELGIGEYLVKELLPMLTIAIIVGDSGLGKSPLLYQLGLCVAAGIPFLGRAVKRGIVLYLDFENGLLDSKGLIECLARHLGLSVAPEDFLTWHLNDSSPNYGKEKNTTLDIIRTVKPTLVIIDSLAACFPKIEDKTSEVTKAYHELREVVRDCGTTIVCVHHIRKPSSKPDEKPASLESGKPHSWFLQARGSRALINGSDIRIGVEVPRTAGNRSNGKAGNAMEVALLLRGFGRIRGEIGPLYLARALDEDGEPVGYDPISGVGLLFNPEQEPAYARLPDVFSFKEAKRIYGKHDQATRDFLNKCKSIGILRQAGKGQPYQKVTSAEKAE